MSLHYPFENLVILFHQSEHMIIDILIYVQFTSLFSFFTQLILLKIIYIHSPLCISGCGNKSFMSFPEVIFGLPEFLSRNRYDSRLESENKHVLSGHDCK